MSTDTEQLWAGQFGDEYHQRNGQHDRSDLWREVLRSMRSMTTEGLPRGTVMELGAGQGDNLAAIRALLAHDDNHYIGADINEGAVKAMAARGFAAIHAPLSELVTSESKQSDVSLMFTRGCLIHIPEHQLRGVFGWMARTARVICFAEYYSPQRRPVADYHGEVDALWADDFAGKFLARHPDWRLVDYGFKYHGDGGDDETWFLLEKVKV